MTYIHYGQRLANGEISQSRVTREPDCLKNIRGNILPLNTLKEIIHTREEHEVHAMIGKKLNLSVEETDVVCRELYREIKCESWMGLG